MHPFSCGNWEYTDNSKAKKWLPQRCEDLYSSAKSKPKYVDNFLNDTRLAHRSLFARLTLPDQDYLAGNYRGADFDCLRSRPIDLSYLNSNSIRVVVHRGHAPDVVAAVMTTFHEDVNDAVQAMLAKKIDVPSVCSEAEYLLFVSEILADLLQTIFTIHPYANGNGHIGRILIAMILLKLKKSPGKWTLDDRPPYDDAVQQHRNGNTQPLIDLILKAIAG